MITRQIGQRAIANPSNPPVATSTASCFQRNKASAAAMINAMMQALYPVIFIPHKAMISQMIGSIAKIKFTNSVTRSSFIPYSVFSSHHFLCAQIGSTNLYFYGRTNLCKSQVISYNFHLLSIFLFIFCIICTIFSLLFTAKKGVALQRIRCGAAPFFLASESVPEYTNQILSRFVFLLNTYLFCISAFFL